MGFSLHFTDTRLMWSENIIIKKKNIIFNMLFNKLLIIPLIFTVCNCERPIVNTPLGQIAGTHRHSFEGKKFSAFEGVPYAKPPIGNKRFEEPEPIEPWLGIWNATETYQCVQSNMLKPNTVAGDEDCLYINVYVPRESPSQNEKLDVVVHIHGGGYSYGNGHSYANPEYLMDRDIIFVTFNYRLGILGFLSTEDDVVPGNNGLKDQVEALKWIQKNIASFGGNPDSVTLTGLSSGASSVQLHYLSPLSKGLFHRGISHSGVALNSWSLQEEPLKRAKKLASLVGCPDTNTEVLVDCLKQRPYKQVVDKFSHFYGYRFTPIAPFAPVIEKGKNAFLNKNPYFLLAKGEIQDLPWLTSNVPHEGLFPAALFKRDLEEINKNWTELAPYLLDYNNSLARFLFKETADEIRNEYLGENGEINVENFLKFAKIFSDRLFLVDAETAVRLQARSNKSPTYYYYFTYPAEDSQNNTIAHGEDVRLFFYKMFPRDPTPDEIALKNILLDMLISFIKNNKPKIEGVTWEPAKFKELKFLNISSHKPEEMKMVSTTENLTPRDFWKNLGLLENQNVVLIKDEL